MPRHVICHCVVWCTRTGSVKIVRTANRCSSTPESHNRSDRHQLTRVLRERSSPVRWDLASPYSEELLWVPDTAAWCWPHPKPQWRNLISPLIRSVNHL